MLHLYWGDGKGKTTAAMGLAQRDGRVAASLRLFRFVHQPGEFSVGAGIDNRAQAT
ncbi:cob(I)yrinic acid a,c-diamide adenosyltransferase, partial [Gemmiger formicilis]|uniref:cob(I)yrinic acid a,c-diamide adenosyltransferase n=1 Tax=Gemmiger formicilis TaxID=745368 RepID=UPI003D320965